MDCSSLDVWHYLKTAQKPVVMYGTGNGAEKLLSIFHHYGIVVSDIFVSDAFYRAQSFCGFNVLTYSDICQKYNDCIVVLSFAVFRPDMRETLREIGSRYELLIPEVPVFGSDYFCMERFQEYEADIKTVYGILADETSRSVFENILNYRLSGKPVFLVKAESPKEEVFSSIIHLGEKEYYLDLGAFDGDTIRAFLERTHSRFAAIYALEPDEKSFRRLRTYTDSLHMENIFLYELASWSGRGTMQFNGGGSRSSSLLTGNKTVQTTDIDSLLDGKPVTFCKMDVEGAEKETITGMKAVIRTQRPRLDIAAYHRTPDLFELPLLLLDINPDYSVFLRHHPYFPAWDTNYYCI